MQKLALFLIILNCFGCAHLADHRLSINLFEDRTFDILCESKDPAHEYEYFLNAKIKKISGSIVDGVSERNKDFRVNSDLCVFEQSERAVGRPVTTILPGLYEVDCKIGRIRFQNDNLQILAQSKPFAKIRKTDGHVWVVNQETCPLNPEDSSNGD